LAIKSDISCSTKEKVNINFIESMRKTFRVDSNATVRRKKLLRPSKVFISTRHEQQKEQNRHTTPIPMLNVSLSHNHYTEKKFIIVPFFTAAPKNAQNVGVLRSLFISGTLEV
jgi:hypothetical protein